MEIKLTEEQIKALQNGEDITIKAPCKLSQPWPQVNDTYYFISSGTNIMSTINAKSKRDLNRISKGNAYRTAKDANRAIKLTQAKQRLKLAIAKANDGWTPDWNNNEYKFQFAFTDNCIKIYTFCKKYQHNWMYIKSKELAKQILKKHKADIELILSE